MRRYVIVDRGAMAERLGEDGAGLPGRLDVGAGFEMRLRARVLAALFAAGATLALLTVVLPHSGRANVAGLLAIVGDAYVVGGLLWWRASDLPAWLLRAALAWGSTLITGVAMFSGESPSPLVFFYLWIFLYSSYFFSRSQAAAQIAYVGAAYGALLGARPPASGIAAWWLVGMGTLLVAAIVIGVMRARVEALIAKLYDAARTDPLTGLANRRGFRETLDLELERARRGGTRMTLVIGDVDRFKEVNDRSGHHVGDAALKRVARLLDASRRAIDAAARVGGDEFALILPDTDEHGAFVLADRMRRVVREEFAGDTVPITMSFGIASFGEHGETAASLIRAADEALYGAKESGRNGTMIHSAALRGALAGGERDVEGERFTAVMLDLAEAMDVRFSGSARHSETVGRYAEMTARALGLPEGRVARVRLAGMLHDIGKVGVPEAILQKPGALSEEEAGIVRRHPELGAQILEHPCLEDVRGWVGAHHERPDGRGYPLGLAGDEIPLEAGILAVADAYEAMTSDRAYRSSIGHAAARAELRRYAGSQFDGLVVEAFLGCLERESERAQELLSSPA
jgi:diguanylate cyclase (GGDEF)-like protein